MRYIKYLGTSMVFQEKNTNFGKFSFAYYTYELMLFQGVKLWFSVFPNYKPYEETEKQY